MAVLKVAHNISALEAHRWLSIADTNLARSLERLSSGYRINRAADDAAGLAISSRLRAQIRSLQQAQRNTEQAIAMIQVAEGTLDQIHNILERLKELATEAASDTVGSEDRKQINKEAQQLLAEIDRISQATKYADQQLLYNTSTTIIGRWTTSWSATIQVGYRDEEYDRIEIQFYQIDTGSLGISNLNLSLLTSNEEWMGAQEALKALDSAIFSVAAFRADLGAYQNRLQYTASNLGVTVQNYLASDSTIRDTDMAQEMVNFTKNQILVQTSMAMLAHANALPQNILALIGR
jgi:flagellin